MLISYVTHQLYISESLKIIKMLKITSDTKFISSIPSILP